MKKNDKKQANPLWGGHFEQGPAAIMQQINQSVSFDWQLYPYDIRGSIAHCQMLAKQKIITTKESKTIIQGLKQIHKEIEENRFTFSESLEDVHMNVEARLHSIIGDVAGKLHTARSRNDQVATDFKLYVRDALDSFDTALAALQRTLMEKAKAHSATLMPGFTHLQTAQPVTVGHHLLAYIEMFGRDRSRLRDARARMNECPLGAAALAGTSFPIDRHDTAKALGFAAPTANSIDSVSDRDFAIEFLSAASLIAMHLSRLAEEIVLWASKEFSFIQLSDQFTTGSSIMPQKRNPDAAELIRAKTGRIFGALHTLLTVMKGLPLTYSKDMQEDKEPVFDATANLALAVNAMTGMMEDLQFNEDALHRAASSGYSTATDLADWLVKELHIPFRKCHSITGKIVRLAEKKHCHLAELSLKELQKIEPGITEKIFDVLSVENSVHSRNSYGGTAPSNVKQSLQKLKKRFAL